MNTRPVPTTLLHRAGVASCLALGATLALHPLTRPGWATTSPLPALAGLLIGVPHGAVDHLVPAWLATTRADRWGRRLGVPAGYLTAAGAGLLAFHLAPTAVLLGFLVLSVGHFGAGDEAFHAEWDGRPVRPRPHAILAYGGPPVIFPLALWPDQVNPLLERIATGSTLLLTTEVRGAALAGTILAMASTAADGLLPAGRRRDLGCLGLLGAVFAVVPPALAFGVYFAAWHSLRHVARLLRADPANADQLRAGRLAPPLCRFAVRAALPTAIVLIGFGLLATGSGSTGPLSPEAGPAGPLPAGFAVLAAITIPHAVVVARLDRATRAGRSQWRETRARAKKATFAGRSAIRRIR